MKRNQSEILLTNKKVKVRTINPNWNYIGYILGKDESLLYLNTDFDDIVYMGVVMIPFSNINYIQEVNEVLK